MTALDHTRPPPAAVEFHRIGLPVGLIVAILGATMLVPAAADAHARNPDWRVFVTSALVVGGLGALLALACYRPWRALTLRECFALVVASWLSASVAGSLPLMLATPGLSLTDAVFETASALTTTGSTVIAGLDSLPPGILLWRSMMQWIGGFGVVAFGLLLLPFLGIGGLQLLRIESSDTYEKTVARINVYARRLVAVYLTLTLACILAYALAGMTVFDAVNHAFTTISTGGFSTHDASFGFFGSPLLLWVCVLFMILGSLPFSLYVRLFDHRRARLLDDVQVRAFLAIVAVLDLMLVAWLVVRQDKGIGEALTQATFNLVSVITTTGYASSDYLLWGTFPVALFFLATLLGGCTGSTSGGIKTFRLVLLWKVFSRQIRALRFPDGAFPIRIGDRPVSEAVALSALAFLMLYLSTMLVFTVAVGLTGLDFVTSLSGVAQALGNVGPGLGSIIGPAGNFSSLPDAAKWLLAAAMIVGRLEIGAAFVVFAPAFWRV